MVAGVSVFVCFWLCVFTCTVMTRMSLLERKWHFSYPQHKPVRGSVWQPVWCPTLSKIKKNPAINNKNTSSHNNCFNIRSWKLKSGNTSKQEKKNQTKGSFLLLPLTPCGWIRALLSKIILYFDSGANAYANDHRMTEWNTQMILHRKKKTNKARGKKNSSYVLQCCRTKQRWGRYPACESCQVGHRPPRHLRGIIY